MIRCILVNVSLREEILLRQVLNEARLWLSLKSGQRVSMEISSPLSLAPVTPETAWKVAMEEVARLPRDARYLFLMRGAGGAVGGHPQPKLAVLGDACIEALIGNSLGCVAIMKNKTICTRDAQLGAVIHELGHTFGLNHEDGDYRSVMDLYEKYPNRTLPKVVLGPVLKPRERLVVKLAWWWTRKPWKRLTGKLARWWARRNRG